VAHFSTTSNTSTTSTAGISSLANQFNLGKRMEKLCYEAIDDGIFFGILQLACSWSSGLLFLVINSFFLVKSGRTACQVLRWVCLLGVPFLIPFLSLKVIEASCR